MKNKGKIGPGTVICSLIALCGALLLYSGSTRVYNSYSSLKWPKVKGEIIGSGISQYEEDHGGLSYTPEVAYAYSFNSDSYVASQIRFVPMILKKEEAQAIADRYPYGRSVVVRCNPLNPAVAVLEPGVFPNTWVHAVLGAVILVSVVIAWWLYLVVRNKVSSERALAGQQRGKAGTQRQDQSNAESLLLKRVLVKIRKEIDKQVQGAGEDVVETGLMSKIAGLIVVGIACWWWGFRDSGGDAGSETNIFQILFGALTGGWVSVFFDVLWKVVVVLAGITAVFLFQKVSTIPGVTPIGDSGSSTVAPEPRDLFERQLQTMGFHYLGDYEVTIISNLPSRLRAYCDPDRHTAVALCDITSGKKTTTVLQFGTNLHPSGSIVTTNSQVPSVYARPPGKIQARVPWKKTAGEVFRLHQLLCQTARAEHFEAETVHAATLVENVRKSERLECEYQVKIGRLKRISEDKYRMTLLGTIIAVPLVWWQMLYGSMLSWVKIPDRFFCWNLRRRLGRIAMSIRIHSDWARCEKIPEELDIRWLEELVDDLIRRGATPWINLGYGNPSWPGGGTDKPGSPLPVSGALDGWDNYVEEVAGKLVDRVKTWEIWDEPNHPEHRIEPGAYAAFVVRTAKILRSVDSRVRIRFGATAGIDVEYTRLVLASLHELDGLGLVDEFSVHPYILNPYARWDGKGGKRELEAVLHKAAPHLRLVQIE